MVGFLPFFCCLVCGFVGVLFVCLGFGGLGEGSLGGLLLGGFFVGFLGFFTAGKISHSVYR